MASNLVDVYPPGGRYLRALGGFAEPVIVSVTQPRADALAVSVRGRIGDTEPALASVRRILGTKRDLSEFERHAGAIPWLAPLARRLRGLKPPRYPALFEACANAIVFQQLSLYSASAIMRRLILALGTTVELDGVPLAVFPSVEGFLGTDDAVLRAAGLSTGKVATLRRVGEAIASGALSEAMLEARSSTDAALLLRGIKGIGPWTAAVILLRRLGRLDVFPGPSSRASAWTPDRSSRRWVRSEACCTSVYCSRVWKLAARLAVRGTLRGSGSPRARTHTCVPLTGRSWNDSRLTGRAGGRGPRRSSAETCPGSMPP